jgi:hypothetical protein
MGKIFSAYCLAWLNDGMLESNKKLITQLAIALVHLPYSIHDMNYR